MNKILGLVVYRADRPGQNRCLVDCLGPALDGLAEQTWGSVGPGRFWVDRYDLRGPHLMALLEVSASHHAKAAQKLEQRLRTWLDDHPADTGPSAGEIEQRHLGCRGRTMCEADTLPGMAANDTYHLFEHPADGFPFGLGRNLPDHDVLWRHLAAVPPWLIRQLGTSTGSDPVSAALGWLVAVDRALDALGGGEGREALSYWRYHASTLIPGAPIEQIATRLPELIGPRNLAAFDNAWGLLESVADPIPGLPWVVETLTATTPHYQFLREIDHTVLRALGLPSALQAPMVLFAWHRRRRSESLA